MANQMPPQPSPTSPHPQMQPMQQCQPMQPGQPVQYYPPVQQPGPGAVMYQPQPGAQVIMPATVVATTPRPNSYLYFSIFVMLCCNFLFGIVALIFSIKSRSATDHGDTASAKSSGSVALGLNIAGIVITLLCVIVAVVLLVTSPFLFWAAAVSSYSDTVGNTLDISWGDSWDSFWTTMPTTSA